MKPMVKLTGRWVALGVMCLLGSQAQAGWLSPCTEAQADLTAQELRINGNFYWCSKPSIWLGQADGSYENLGAPLEKTNVAILADLSGATVVEGATQNVMVKCGWIPRCGIDVAFQGECQDCSGAPVARTGQTATYAVGDDGDLQKGVAWPTPRFTDNSDGTVTDNLTGLIWLKNANCTDTVGGVDKSSDKLSWANALIWSNNLASGACGLNDGSSADDWRLPNINELLSLLDVRYHAPPLPNSIGTGQWTEGDPFLGVKISSNPYYWSSTSDGLNADYAWYLRLSDGITLVGGKLSITYVWPVRDKQ